MVKKLLIFLCMNMICFSCNKSKEAQYDLGLTEKVIDTKNYKSTLDSIQKIKASIRNKSQSEIGKSFTNLITTKVFPYWYGTPWDFYGMTEQPNQGKIACGYFVTTTLRDMGVKLDRIKLAQCVSEQMITTLVSKKNVYRCSNYSIEKFEQELKKTGNGLFIVGLDFHTGFVLISDKGSFFIHSSGIKPLMVVKENLLNSKLIVKSKYRVVGKISDDKFFLDNWINH